MRPLKSIVCSICEMGSDLGRLRKDINWATLMVFGVGYQVNKRLFTCRNVLN